jgi:hypothetical protein
LLTIRPVASHWQTLSHNVVSSSSRLISIDCTGSCNSNYRLIVFYICYFRSWFTVILLYRTVYYVYTRCASLCILHFFCCQSYFYSCIILLIVGEELDVSYDGVIILSWINSQSSSIQVNIVWSPTELKAELNNRLQKFIT